MQSSGESVSKSFTLGELTRHVDGTLKGSPEVRIGGVAPLSDAGPDQISFVSDRRAAKAASNCRAAALIVDASFPDQDRPLLITANPYLAFARIAQLFAERPELPPGIHPSAFIGPGVRLGSEVCIGPLASIEADSSIGQGTGIYGSVYVGRGVSVGEQCLIYPGVILLDRCRIGNRVTIHSGTVIGSDGFGFAQDENGRHVKVPHLGTVQIDDDVEIGANCTIDRGTLGMTWIQQGTKIDNLVMIAHNVVVGQHNLLVAQVGVSGSTRLGNHVVLAGQVGVVGHITIGDRVRVGAQSGVAHSVPAEQDMMGSPAVPQKEWFRNYSNIHKLSRLKEEVKSLKGKIAELEKALQGNADA
jgi:UDP-3-O-[3-hydroxymyristoyl] glucosamine N-acyltransferase